MMDIRPPVLTKWLAKLLIVVFLLVQVSPQQNSDGLMLSNYHTSEVGFRMDLPFHLPPSWYSEQEAPGFLLQCKELASLVAHSAFFAGPR